MTAPPDNADKEVRRFACTACGKCCDRGPEMELSEATALADKFITSVIFKVHSLPISDRAGSAASWWRSEGSRIPIRPALEECRRHLSQFASRKRTENRRERQIFLTISAIVHDDGRKRCPALIGNLCGVYDVRPLTCRTVPLHYSRPPSVLRSYLDRFTGTPDYRCDTSQAAPVVLDGNRILDPAIRHHRDQAIDLARAERAWKDHLLTLMDDAERAQAAGLPTYDDILRNTDSGYATLLPMIVAWRVAKTQGLLSSEVLQDICRKQAALIQVEIGRSAGERGSSDLRDSLAVYEFELSKARRAGPNPALLANPSLR